MFSRLFLALSLASPIAASAQAVRHPDARYVKAPFPPTFVAALTDPVGPPPFQLGKEALARFGDEQNPDSTLLGDILGAAFLPDGRLALLDDKLLHLRLFDDRAQPLQSLGRAGQGPGEFSRRLLSLTVDPSARLLVADLSRSVKFYTPTKSGYRYSSVVGLGVSPRAMCVIGATLVVLAPVADHPEAIHTFDLQGTKSRDFGPIYDSPNPAYNYQFVEGHLACDTSHQMVYFAPQDGFGEVRAYRADGTAVWRTTINGFSSNVVEDVPGGYQVIGSPAGVHTVRSVTILPRVGLLVQIAHRTPKDLNDGSWYSTLTSFLLDFSSGKPRSLGTDLPLIVAATLDRVVVIDEDPVPHFEIHALTAP